MALRLTEVGAVELWRLAVPVPKAVKFEPVTLSATPVPTLETARVTVKAWPSETGVAGLIVKATTFRLAWSWMVTPLLAPEAAVMVLPLLLSIPKAPALKVTVGLVAALEARI